MKIKISVLKDDISAVFAEDKYTLGLLIKDAIDNWPQNDSEIIDLSGALLDNSQEIMAAVSELRNLTDNSASDEDIAKSFLKLADLVSFDISDDARTKLSSEKVAAPAQRPQQSAADNSGAQQQSAPDQGASEPSQAAAQPDPPEVPFQDPEEAPENDNGDQGPEAPDQPAADPSQDAAQSEPQTPTQAPEETPENDGGQDQADPQENPIQPPAPAEANHEEEVAEENGAPVQEAENPAEEPVEPDQPPAQEDSEEDGAAPANPRRPHSLHNSQDLTALAKEGAVLILGKEAVKADAEVKIAMLGQSNQSGQSASQSGQEHMTRKELIIWTLSIIGIFFLAIVVSNIQFIPQ